MADLRGRLLNPVATATTAQDVRLLTALTARDAEDELGEATLNRLALTAWATRLPLATGLEYDAAMWAARGLVETSVASEDHSETFRLASLYNPHLPEDDHRLAFGVARATAYDGLGQHDEAAALVDSLAVAFAPSLSSEQLEGLQAFRDDLDLLMAAGSAQGSSASPPAISSVGARTSSAPEFKITSLAPNPTQGELRLGLAVPERARVRLDVFDVLGRRVLTVSESPAEPGTSWLALDVSPLPSGVYILRMLALPERGTSTVLSRKFTMVR